MDDSFADRVAEAWQRYRTERRAFRSLASGIEPAVSPPRASFERYRVELKEFSRLCREELRLAGAQAQAAGREADRVRDIAAALGASGDFAADVLRMIEDDQGRGETGRAVAYSLRDTPLTRELGELAVGMLAARRRLWRFASESFAACGVETLARYQLRNALEAFVATGAPEAGGLARAASGLLPEIGSRLGAWDLLRAARCCAALGIDGPMERFLAAAVERRPDDARLSARAAGLRRHRAAAKAAAAALGSGEDHAAVFAAALDVPTPAAGDRVQIGVLDYGSPTLPSTNIGDHIQTVGVLGQLGAFEFADLEAAPEVLAILAAERKDARRAVSVPVRIVPVDRDFALAQSTLGRIWLPVCGWFQHESYVGRHDFPFPGNMLPIYMALHVAEPGILSDAAIEHLRRFAPVGCRDLNTVRLLRSAGVPAFLNGCVTLTLGRLFPPHDPDQGPRQGRFFADYIDQGQAPGGYTFVGHQHEEMVVRSFGENIAVAAEMLGRYRRAEAVRTPLLHCYLPCRAMGTPVEFVNKALANPRFEGLVGVPDAEVQRLADRFEAKFRSVMAAIVSGAEPDDVLATWRELCAPDMAHTGALLVARERELRLKLPSPEGLDPARVAAVPRQCFGPTNAGDAIDLVFCFDAALAEPFLGTLRSAAAHASRPLRVHILGRDLKQDFAEVLGREFPGVGFAIYDTSGIGFGAVRLLPHTSVSTMDRLIAPEVLRDVGRAIYLDVDLLVRGDLAELAAIALGDTAVAARDSLDVGWRTGSALLLELANGMEPDTAGAFRSTVLGEGTVRFDAFNAGVLVMDFDRLRGAGFTRRTVDLVGRFGVNDQAALNFFVREKRTRLAAEWNHFPSQEKLADPRIVHFVGPLKPWHRGFYHPWFEAWRAHASSAEAGAGSAAADRVESG
jgi:lipopolysaccharide biosynthesis glycosyltransferase